MIDQVESLKTAIKAIGNTQRAKLDDIRLDDVKSAILGAAATFDPIPWSQLAEDKQNELKERLMAVRDALLAVTHTNGPKEPNLTTSCMTTTARITAVRISGRTKTQKGSRPLFPSPFSLK